MLALAASGILAEHPHLRHTTWQDRHTMRCPCARGAGAVRHCGRAHAAAIEQPSEAQHGASPHRPRWLVLGLGRAVPRAPNAGAPPLRRQATRSPSSTAPPASAATTCRPAPVSVACSGASARERGPGARAGPLRY